MEFGRHWGDVGSGSGGRRADEHSEYDSPPQRSVSMSTRDDLSVEEKPRGDEAYYDDYGFDEGERDQGMRRQRGGGGAGPPPRASSARYPEVPVPDDKLTHAPYRSPRLGAPVANPPPSPPVQENRMVTATQYLAAQLLGASLELGREGEGDGGMGGALVPVDEFQPVGLDGDPMDVPPSINEIFHPNAQLNATEVCSRPTILFAGPFHPPSDHPLALRSLVREKSNKWAFAEDRYRPMEGKRDEEQDNLFATLKKRDEHPLRQALRTCSAKASPLVTSKQFDFGPRTVSSKASCLLPSGLGDYVAQQTAKSRRAYPVPGSTENVRFLNHTGSSIQRRKHLPLQPLGLARSSSGWK